MSLKAKVYQEHGTRVMEDVLPDGYTVIDTFHPCGTVTPWDYHGMRHQREYIRVLRAAGIEAIALTTLRKDSPPTWYWAGRPGSIRRRYDAGYLSAGRAVGSRAAGNPRPGESPGGHS